MFVHHAAGRGRARRALAAFAGWQVLRGGGKTMALLQLAADAARAMDVMQDAGIAILPNGRRPGAGGHVGRGCIGPA